MSTPNSIPLTYNGFVQQIANFAVEPVQETGGVWAGVDAPFNTMLPQALNYAELRIQRDLDLQGMVTTRTYAVVTGNQQLLIPVNDFVVPDTLVVNGVPLTPVTRAFLQNIYAPGTTQGQPLYFAPGGGDAATGGATSAVYLLGPIPDQNYPAVLSGTIRMPSLAGFATAGPADTATTLISNLLPDLLLMAAMVFVSGWQKNFGAQSDDAAMAVSYEGQYKALLAGAQTEEFRKKYQAAAWSSASPSPIASPAAPGG